MNSSGIAQRYARAIFDLAVEEGRFEEVGKELAALSQGIRADADGAAALGSPSSTREDAQRMAEALIGGLKPSTITANALRLLADRRRLAQLPEVEAHYRKFADAKAGRVRARVTSAAPLSDQAAQQITAQLSATTQRNVVIERAVDPSLIGGVVAQVGSLTFDGSLKSQLEELKKQLKA